MFDFFVLYPCMPRFRFRFLAVEKENLCLVDR